MFMRRARFNCGVSALLYALSHRMRWGSKLTGKEGWDLF